MNSYTYVLVKGKPEDGLELSVAIETEHDVSLASPPVYADSW